MSWSKLYFESKTKKGCQSATKAFEALGGNILPKPSLENRLRRDARRRTDPKGKGKRVGRGAADEASGDTMGAGPRVSEGRSPYY